MVQPLHDVRNRRLVEADGPLFDTLDTGQLTMLARANLLHALLS